MLKEGDVLGDYVIARPLASGGMGTVHLASGPDGVRVALKTVRSASTGRLRALRREIRALLRIDHPSVVRVVGHGLYDPVPWFAMEYIVGDSLESLLPWSDTTLAISSAATTTEFGTQLTPMPSTGGVRRPIDAAGRERLLGYVAKVLRGLAFMHADGVVHGDLKPGNIVVRSSNDEPVLVDFGIASSSGGPRERLTAVGRSAGTPAYIAPEQASGAWLDPRADLYSIGCMIFEILTGEPPYVGNSKYATILSHIHDEIPELPDDVDPRLRRLVRRLLSKAPDERPSFAHDVARTLEEVLGVAPAFAPPPPFLQRAQLVGRDEVLAEVDDLVNEYRVTETPDVYAIAGASGSGKSRIAIEIALRLRASKLHVIPIDIGTDRDRSPFTPVLAEIADICRAEGPVFTRQVLADEVGFLGKTLPALFELPGLEHLETAPDMPPQFETVRRTRALMNAVSDAFGDRPIVMVIDEYVEHLGNFLDAFRRAATAGSGRVMMIFTIDDRYESVIDDFPRDRVLRIRSLSAGEVETMAASMLGLAQLPEAVGQFLARRSNGVPAEVARYLALAVERGLVTWGRLGGWRVDPSPEAWSGLPAIWNLGAFVEGQLQRLSSAARELAELVALAGSAVPISVVDELAGSPDVLDGLDPWFASGHLRMEGEYLSFADDRFAAGVLEWVDAASRPKMHGRIADAMTTRGFEITATAAKHRKEAGQLGKARAIFLALADPANESATQWEFLREYLDCDPEDSLETLLVLERYALGSRITGRYAEAERAARLGIALARSLGDENREARHLANLAQDLQILGRPHEEVGREALALAERIGDSEAASRVHTYLANVATANREYDLSVEHRRKALEVASPELVYLRLWTAANYGYGLTSAGRFDEAQVVLTQLLEEVRGANYPRVEGYVAGNLAAAVRESRRDYDLALELLERSRELHTQTGDRLGQDGAALERIVTLVRAGRYEEAVACANEAFFLTRMTELNPFAEVRARTALFAGLLGCGHSAGARGVANDLLGFDDEHARLRGELLLAALERRLGHYVAARELIAAIRERGVLRPEDDYALHIEELFLAAALEGSSLPQTAPPLEPGANDYAREQFDRVVAAIEAQRRGEPLLHGECEALLVRQMPSAMR